MPLWPLTLPSLTLPPATAAARLACTLHHLWAAAVAATAATALNYHRITTGIASFVHPAELELTCRAKLLSCCRRSYSVSCAVRFCHICV